MWLIWKFNSFSIIANDFHCPILVGLEIGTVDDVVAAIQAFVERKMQMISTVVFQIELEVLIINACFKNYAFHCSN